MKSMPKLFNFSSARLPLLAAVLVFSLSAGYFTLAWSEPAGTMPVSASAPINIGGTAQNKAGDLSIGTGLKYTISKYFDSFALKNSFASTTFVIGQDGNVGIGTLTPASKLDVNGIIRNEGSDFVLGTNDGRSIGATTTQRALVHYLNDTLHLNYQGDFEGGTVIGGSTTTVSGSFCIGTVCVNSSAWNTIVSGGGGGSNNGATIPISLYGPDDRSLSGYDSAFDPSTNKLTIVGNPGGYSAGKTIILENNLFNSSVSTLNGLKDMVGFQGTTLSAVTIGDVFCILNTDFGRDLLLDCPGYGAYCKDGNFNCKNFNGRSYLPNSAPLSYAPSVLRTDGTNLYAIGSAYMWKISFSGGMHLEEEGPLSLLPTVNGVNVLGLGSSLPYNGSIYQVTLIPDYFYYVTGTGTRMKGTAGYSSLTFGRTGSY